MTANIFERTRNCSLRRRATVGEGSAFMFQPGFNPVGFVLQDIFAVNGIFGLKVESSLAL